MLHVFAQPAPNPAAVSTPILESSQLVFLVALYVFLLVFAVMAPVLVDIFKAYSFARETRSVLIQKLATSDLDSERLKLIMAELDVSPPGIPGLGRSTMAFTIILILGASVLHLLVIPTAGGNSPVVGNVLSLLGGALASVIGFYFGGKTSQEGAQQVSQTQPARATMPTGGAPPPTTTPTPPPEQPQ